MDLSHFYEAMAADIAWIPQGVKEAICVLALVAYCRWAWTSSQRRRK